jgi:hypothetical protein
MRLAWTSIRSYLLLRGCEMQKREIDDVVDVLAREEVGVLVCMASLQRDRPLG